MLNKTAVGLIGFSIIGAAHASNWVPLSVRNNGSFMVDADSIVHESNGAVRAWFLKRQDAPAMEHGAKYDSIKFVERLYCKSRLISAGPAHWYYGDEQVYSEKGYGTPSEIVPDSVGEGFYDALCTRKNM